MTQATDQTGSVVDRVVAALEDGLIADARRLLVRARRTAEDDHARGTIAGLEVACTRLEAADGEPWRAQLEDLRGAETEQPERFANAVGCALSEVGHGLEDDRLLDLADEWFRDASPRFPDTITFANHGVVLRRLERHADAAAAFGRALELDPDFQSVRIQRGRCLVEAGELDAAADEYRTYLAARPDDAHEWISLAIVECDAGRIEAAEQAYWRAAGLQPTNVSLHYNWLITARRVGDDDRAAYARRKLEEIAPDDWRTHLSRSMALADAGDARGAFALVADLLRERSLEERDGDSEMLPEHIAAHAADLGVAPELRAEALRLVDDMIGRRALPESLLDLHRQLEAPDATPVRDFAILIDALYAGDAPHGSLVNYRVYAADEADARVLAADFELRCGATEAQVDEIEELAAPDDPDHRGVWWRPGEAHYPADEFKK